VGGNREDRGRGKGMGAVRVVRGIIRDKGIREEGIREEGIREEGIRGIIKGDRIKVNLLLFQGNSSRVNRVNSTFKVSRLRSWVPDNKGSSINLLHPPDPVNKVSTRDPTLAPIRSTIKDPIKDIIKDPTPAPIKDTTRATATVSPVPHPTDPTP
jgi:hypothetical protein